MWGIFTKTRLSGGSLRRFFWYGTSYEAKLRQLVNTPNLPANSILYAGWLGDGKIQNLPNDVDVTVYGMSFSAYLADAMHELRPQQRQRVIAGPGAPLNQTYWKGFPTQENSYCNPTFWHLTYGYILPFLDPAQ